MDRGDSLTPEEFDKTVEHDSSPKDPDSDDTVSSIEIPERLGRYSVQGMLGRGGFARVLLAHDAELDRLVALKIPRMEKFRSSSRLQMLLDEARMAARLRHPGIVTVHDVGGTDSIPYIVMEYIRGRTLAQFMRSEPVSCIQATQLIREIADALQHAHNEGFVHRDLKPQNILLDNDDRPHISDFGLALRHRDVADFSTRLIGTPEHMAPEQAAGENHRIDQRTDIWALGAIYYQMLCGKMPFVRGNLHELLQRIIAAEYDPPSKVDPHVPAELERICMRCLSRRMSERYRDTAELIADLDLWLHDNESTSGSGAHLSGVPLSWARTGVPAAPFTPLVPRGLRPFESQDAGFFMRLLPGPYDRNGLPTKLRFLKESIEQRDPEQTFRVGLLYGPSGSGKSSLVRAGLLPQLEQVTAIYVDATAPRLEKRLRSLLARRLDFSPAGGDLPSAMFELRESERSAKEAKVLIVIDQFEQWLCRGELLPSSELVQALRQCDGARLQCLLLVRDDFWLTISRFMNLLEIGIVDDVNAALIDSFDKEHARRVLIEFGVAYGCLPGHSHEFTSAQQIFLDRSIDELAEEGRLYPIRLVVFAEMVRDKPWQPATLDQLGGVEGIGVAFLDRAIGRYASAARRVHTDAARRVLAALLPSRGLIKEVTPKQSTLKELSGYASAPRDFDQLMHLLDTELRLLTPLSADDPDGTSWTTDSGDEEHREPRYQLTHDFLVPSIREWLERDLRSSPQGRLQLMLQEQAELWSSRRSSRFLPSLAEWLRYQLLTHHQDWSERERDMLATAGRHLGRRTALVTLFLVFVVFTGSLIYRRWDQERRVDQAEYLFSTLQDVEMDEVPALIDELQPSWSLVEAKSRQLMDDASQPIAKRLRAAMLELRRNPQDLSQILDWLMDEQVPASDLPVAVSELLPHRKKARETLIEALRDEQRSATPRLRAAAMLATFDAPALGEMQLEPELTATLLQQPATDAAVWIEMLRPLAPQLQQPLVELTASVSNLESARIGVLALSEYSEPDWSPLRDMLATANGSLFRAIVEKFRQNPSQSLAWLHESMDRLQVQAPTAPSSPAEFLTHANLALAALVLGDPLPLKRLTRRRPDQPRFRVETIAAITPERIEFSRLLAVIQEHSEEPDVGAALLLAAAKYHEIPGSQPERVRWIRFLRERYVASADREVHAAAGMLLERWGVDTTEIDRRLAALPRDEHQDWYVDRLGQTMMVVSSEEMELLRPGHEESHAFAISATEVTLRLFQRYVPDVVLEPGLRTSMEDAPVTQQTAIRVAEFCNRLSQDAEIDKSQWCYPSTDEQVASDWIPYPDYLKRTGYRLPTVEEWQTACAAATGRSWLDGIDAETGNHYIWSRLNGINRLQPVAQLLPNPFGLFDVYGNAAEICMSESADDTAQISLRMHGGTVISTVDVILSELSAQEASPHVRSSYGGFRVVRSLPGDNGL